MKYLIIPLVCIFSITTLSAQSLYDALQFSTIESASTARMAGIGGGMSALGGEFSVINVNPAGLAIYRSSEFSLTPSLNFKKSEGLLASGRENEENDVFGRNKTAFSFSNLGVVLNSKPRGKWKTSNLAIGYNRIADFKESFFFSGQSAGSMADQFLELATGDNGLGIPAGELDDFLAGPAFDASAIGQFLDEEDNLRYFNDFVDFPNAIIERELSIERLGSISELSISFAGNLRNKLLLGGSLGVPLLNFIQVREYEEFDIGPDGGTVNGGNVDFFESLRFTDTLSTEGVGINAKFGMIYWPTAKIRVGAAIHTPTFYTLTDFYDTTVEYTVTEFNSEINEEETTSRLGLPFETRFIDYGFRTPWRYIGSAGLIIPGLGLLSAEVEYVDYSGSKYNLNKEGNSSFDVERGEKVNDEINTRLTSAVNVRVGAEYMIKRFLVRAGYNWLGANQTSTNDRRSRISLGTGYRANQFYLDLAYVRGSNQSSYTPYTLEQRNAEQRVARNLTTNKVLFTFGYRF